MDLTKGIIIVIIIAAGLFLLRDFNSKPALTNLIVDDTIGIKFDIDADFERIEQEDLQLRNPLNIYGFNPPGSTDSACIVSQTDRLKSGDVSAEDLAYGTIEQIRQTVPDLKITESGSIILPNAIEAAKVEISYTQDGVEFNRYQVIATTDERTTFAYCYAPASSSEYVEQFDRFLSSLIIS